MNFLSIFFSVSFSCKRQENDYGLLVGWLCLFIQKILNDSLDGHFSCNFYDTAKAFASIPSSIFCALIRNEMVKIMNHNWMVFLDEHNNKPKFDQNK